MKCEVKLLVKPNLVFWPGALYLVEEKKAVTCSTCSVSCAFLGKKVDCESRRESDNAQLIVFVPGVFMILSVVLLTKF